MTFLSRLNKIKTIETCKESAQEIANISWYIILAHSPHELRYWSHFSTLKANPNHVEHDPIHMWFLPLDFVCQLA